MKQNLRENLFQTIANTIAKLAFKTVKLDLNNDPSIKDTLKSLKFWTDELERIQANRCKSWPDDPKCKEMKKGK